MTTYDKNNYNFTGVLTEATQRVTKKGSVWATFKVESVWKEDKEPIENRCTAWGQQATVVLSLPLGSRIEVEGPIDSRTVPGYDGKSPWKSKDVVANRVAVISEAEKHGERDHLEPAPSSLPIDNIPF